MRLASRFVGVLAALGFAYGCSVINAPDDVVPQGSTAGSSHGGSGGSGIGNSAGDGAGGDFGGGAAGGGAEAGAAGEAGAGPQEPSGGLLVVGAEDEDGARQLAVLNPRTGAELAREALPVAAVAYDEAADRQLWFVFTASAFPARPNGTADLEVRSFDQATGKWTVLGRGTSLPPPQPDQLVVLNQRLAYLSYSVVSGKTMTALTLLDTSDPKNVGELATSPAAAGETFVGLVGQRGSDVNESAAGGRLRLMIADDCGTGDDADCRLRAQQVFAANRFTAGDDAELGRFVGQPRFLLARREERLFAVLRSTSPSNRLVVRSFSGPSLESPTNFTITQVAGSDIGGFDLLECVNGGVFTDVDGEQLVAFHLASGQVKTQALSHPGAPVYSDSFSSSALVLDPTAAGGLLNVEVSRSGTTSLVLNPRASFTPPADLAPYTGAARRSVSGACE